MPTFESTKNGYRSLWSKMKVTRTAECDKAARRILAGRSRYEAVERKTGVPWFWIGIIHMRESNNNFAKHLHNGDPLTARTTHVPPGRPATGSPPFTWEASAMDALTMHGLHNIAPWPLERIGYEAERYNGWGYFGRHNSPYLWAGSNLYTMGKYVADGKYSSTTIDQQLGVMPVLATLCKLSPEVNERVNGKKPPMPEITTGVGGGGAVVTVGIQQGWGMTEWIMAGLVAVAAICIVIAIIRKRRQEPTDLPAIVNDPSRIEPRAGAAKGE